MRISFKGHGNEIFNLFFHECAHLEAPTRYLNVFLGGDFQFDELCTIPSSSSFIIVTPITNGGTVITKTNFVYRLSTKKLEVEQAKIPYNLFFYIWDLQVGLTPELIIPQIYSKLYPAEGHLLPYFFILIAFSRLPRESGW